MYSQPLCWCIAAFEGLAQAGPPPKLNLLRNEMKRLNCIPSLLEVGSASHSNTVAIRLAPTGRPPSALCASLYEKTKRPEKMCHRISGAGALGRLSFEESLPGMLSSRFNGG
ncbi:unnamed protein product [Effrenium voratum]|nr:unnamed protein product [Effrenium voratum]